LLYPNGLARKPGHVGRRLAAARDDLARPASKRGYAAHRQPAELYLRRLPSVLHCGCKTARGVECQAPSLTINRMGGANVAGRNVTQDPADPDPDLADVLRPPRIGLTPRRGGHQA
jgi:hypothetical protein